MRFVMNEVSILVTGENAFRLLQLIKNRNCTIHQLKPVSNGYQFQISVRDLKNAKNLFRKCHVRIHIIKKSKISDLVRVRKTILALFLFLSVILLFWMESNLRIARIYLNGQEVAFNQFENLFMDTKIANQISIYPYMRKKKLVLKELNDSIRNSNEDISYVNSYYQGNSLWIDILYLQKHSNLNQMEYTNTPKNIVSDQCGIIDSMIVRRGTPRVKVGDYIENGMVLVEGKVAYLDNQGVERLMYVKADATVTISYEKTITLYRKNNSENLLNTDGSLENTLSKFVESLEEKGVTIKEKNVTIETNQEGKTLICTFLLQESVGILEDGRLSDDH